MKKVYIINYVKIYKKTGKREFTSIVHGVTSFELIILVIAVHGLLHALPGITNRLQGPGVDISSVINGTKNASSTTEEKFNVIFEKAGRLTEKVNTHNPRCLVLQKIKSTETTLKLMVIKLITDKYLLFVLLMI